MGPENVEAGEGSAPGQAKRHPHAVRDRLQGLAKGIVADIRKNEQISDSLSFVFECLEPELDGQLTKCIDSLWSRYDLSEKAKVLIQMQENSTNNHPAWRPETGNYNIRPYKQYSLEKKLRCLQQRVADDEEVITELESHVVTLRENIEKVTEDMIKLMPA